jgi:nucleotide sugar dehydrogenase
MKIYGKSASEVSEAFRNGQVTVAVYGLGKMGLPLAALFADAGAKVIGADISSAVVDSINKGKNHILEEPGLSELVERNVKEGRLRATTDLAAASKESDVKIILVPTLIKNHKPDLTPVYAVAESIAKGLSSGDIVITECTMPPGSTEELIPILEKSGLSAGKDYGIGHCPERTMTGTAIRDIKGRYPKIVGAIDEKTKNVLVGIYSVINANGVIPVSGIRAAELVKVFEGVYRDVNIGLANELTMVCEKCGVSYMEIQKAANSMMYCHLHTPGGVGGHCIPYYPYFIMDEDTVITLTARHVNEHMPNHIINKAKDALKEKGKDLRTANVLVLGIAFRGGVKETIKSTALELIAKLKKEAHAVYVYDPLYTKEETEKFNVNYLSSYRDIDCIILMADHKEFFAYDWKKIASEVRTKALVDGKQIVDPKSARDAGFAYRGVGFI